MRARNPWVRARFSLLGWKVRFIALNLHICRDDLSGQKKAGKSTRRLKSCQQNNTVQPLMPARCGDRLVAGNSLAEIGQK